MKLHWLKREEKKNRINEDHRHRRRTLHVSTVNPHAVKVIAHFLPQVKFTGFRLSAFPKSTYSYKSELENGEYEHILRKEILDQEHTGMPLGGSHGPVEELRH